MKRPLGLVALFYGGGLLLAEFFPSPVAFLFTLSLGLAIGAICFSSVRTFCIWPLIVLTGWTNLGWRTSVISPNDLRIIQRDSAQIVSVRGTLAETPTQRMFIRDEEESWRTLARVAVNGIQKQGRWQPAFGTIVVTTQGLLPPDFFDGQTVEISGVIAPPPPPLADGLFDFQTYLRRQEIYFQLKTESSNDWKTAEPVKTSLPLADRFRVWARDALAIGMPNEDESLQLERALTLGDKTFLTEEVSEPFVRAATYHIFAVDGLRMAIIFGIFFSLFRVLGVPRAWCGIMLLPLLWSYTALTGWPASAIRATVMLSVIIGGWVFKRPGDLLNSLFAAAIIILVWDPQQLFQAGFQLSFLVVLCMILILPTFDKFAQWILRSDPLLAESLRPRWRKILETPARFLLDLFFVSLAAWLGSIPLAAYYFHIFTPVSGPANVVAVPLCALVLASNFISLLLASWLPVGAEIFNHAGWFLMESIRVTSHWFEQWPAAYRYVSAPNLFSTTLYYALLLAIFTGWLFQPKWRRAKFSGLIFLPMIWCFQFARESSATHLAILPLNGGSAIFCDAPGSKNDLLVDCGDSNSVRFVMKPFLRAQGVNNLPHLALTHGDVRHVGGFELLAENFPIEQLGASSVRFRSSVYRSVVEKFSSRLLTLNRGETFSGWTILHPGQNNHFSDADNNTLVLRAEINNTRILLLSDLGRLGQEKLLDSTNDLRADIVVTCLPEKGEPLADELLDVIQPQLIIVTDSQFPANKRASSELHERLEKRGVPVLFTLDVGAVEIVLTENHWRAKTRVREFEK